MTHRGPRCRKLWGEGLPTSRAYWFVLRRPAEDDLEPAPEIARAAGHAEERGANSAAVPSTREGRIERFENQYGLAALMTLSQEPYQVEARLQLRGSEPSDATQQVDRLRPVVSPLEVAASFEQGPDRLALVTAAAVGLCQGDPGLDVLGQPAGRLSPDSGGLLRMACLRVGECGDAEVAPGIKVLAGTGQQWRDAQMDGRVARFDGQHPAVEPDRPLPAPAAHCPLRLRQDPGSIVRVPEGQSATLPLSLRRHSSHAR